jgi:hypothetical protein
MKVADTILAVLSDMHTGSSTALFPRNGFMNDEGNVVKPNARQAEMFPVWVRLTAEIAAARKGKRLIVVNLGDAIDGIHHNSYQECLFKSKEQVNAHLEMMAEFLKKTGFNSKHGDELYYVRGTEVHVNDDENPIAKDLGAVMAGEKQYVHEILEMPINGMYHVFAHHGKARGTGGNEGNALRNFLRDVRADREKDGLKRIDVLWSGHTHGHTYNTHIARRGGEFHEMHGVICPSFQAKTRYALAKVPMAVNSVGGVYARITADGDMPIPKFVVKSTKDS